MNSKNSNNFDWNKLAKYAAIGVVAVFLLLWIVIPAAEIILSHAGKFLMSYIDNHPLFFSVMTLIAVGIGYIAYEASITPPPTPAKAMPEPTAQDYFKILETVRPAVAEIASTLGLAPIDNHTDMAADGAERILRWDKVWGFRYKARKLAATTNIDVEQARRVIQAQVGTVLDRDNPSKLSEINFNYCGHLEPVIQIAEVKDDDAYIFIYVVMASDTYFKQKEAENRASTLHTQAEASDTDF